MVETVTGAGNELGVTHPPHPNFFTTSSHATSASLHTRVSRVITHHRNGRRTYDSPFTPFHTTRFSSSDTRSHNDRTVLNRRSFSDEATKRRRAVHSTGRRAIPGEWLLRGTGERSWRPRRYTCEQCDKSPDRTRGTSRTSARSSPNRDSLCFVVRKCRAAATPHRFARRPKTVLLLEWQKLCCFGATPDTGFGNRSSHSLSLVALT